MRENKPKIQKLNNGNKERIKMSSLAFSLLSLLCAIALFGGLIFLQNYFAEDITYKTVVVMKTDAPRNTVVTYDNAEELFELKSVNILNVTSDYLETVDDIIGCKAQVELLTGEIISRKDFEDINSYIKNFKDPVEISIAVENIADADGGKIRAGDLVNVTMMFTNAQLGKTSAKGTSSIAVNSNVSTNDGLFSNFIEATEIDMGLKEKTEDTDTENTANNSAITYVDPYAEQPSVSVYVNKDSGTEITSYNYETWAQYIMESLYVEKVLDSSGVEIDPTDTVSSAGIIVFIVEKADEIDINNALVNCSSMRISRIVNKPEIKIPENMQKRTEEEATAVETKTTDDKKTNDKKADVEETTEAE